jgi:hypothetical protein
MILAAEETKSAIETIGVPLTVAMIGALATVGAAAVTFVFARLGEAAARRRDGYARASRALVALAEYPYRIRRRTSDSPEALANLADRGSELQEELRCCDTWVRCENPRMGQVWDEVLADLRAATGPASNEAWEMPPVSKAADMNIGPWGPQGVEAKLERFENAAAWRFGGRRMVGWAARSAATGERGAPCQHVTASPTDRGGTKPQA